MINIVEATEAQFPIINDIAHRTWPHTFGAILSPTQIAYMLEWMYSIDSLREQVQRKGHRFVLAEQDGEYWGYASYQHSFDGEPKTKLHKIYVLPESQGRGVGQALMAHVVAKAIAAGDTSLLLNVNRDNNAVRFYERVGFEVIATEDIDIGGGYWMNDFVMEKKLTN